MLDKDYWNDRWIVNNTGWDIGHSSPPLMKYLSSLENTSIRILIPCSGNGYEAGEAYRSGCTHIYYNDISQEAARRFKKRFPEFPDDQILISDLFDLKGKFELILEQTSFCAQPPSKRKDYIKKVHELLQPDGCFAGVLFNEPFPFEGPPFGGNEAEYERLFSSKFEIIKMEKCYNSIIPRQEKELFVILQPK